MSEAAETKARHAAMLGQLAELGLALAADLQRRALAAEDDETAARLADSFHKVGRSVRQTLALEARLLRDHAADAREASAVEDRTRPLRIAVRQREVRRRVERLIWTEVEDEHEAEVAVDMARDLTAHPADLDDDFADAPIEVIVQRLKDRIFRELAAYRAQAAAAAGHEVIEGDFSPAPELRNSA